MSARTLWTRSIHLTRSCGSMLAAAFAAGLSAHLLGTNLTHDGSLRDLILLGIAIGISAGLAGGLNSSGRVIAGIGIASLCVAVGWLFLEDPAHVQSSQVIATLCALLPILCALVCAILLFARAAIVFASAIAELLLGTLPQSGTDCVRAHRFVAVRVRKIQDTGPPLFLRRGPPHAPRRVLISA